MKHTEEKIYRESTARSPVLAHRAAASSFKILHKASQMLRTQGAVEACWLNWVDLDFQGFIIYIFTYAPFNDILDFEVHYQF